MFLSRFEKTNTVYTLRCWFHWGKNPLFHHYVHFYESAYIFITKKVYARLAKVPPHRKCRPGQRPLSPAPPLRPLTLGEGPGNKSINSLIINIIKITYFRW